MYKGVWWVNRRVKDLLERPRRRREDNVVVYVKNIVLEGVKWMGLADNRDRQWVVVNTVGILGFLKMRGISRIAEELLASQKRNVLLVIIYRKRNVQHKMVT